MPGGSTTTQDQKQNTDPWAPAQPMLKGELSKLGGMDTSVTPWQSGALKDLFNSTTGLPNFGASGSNLTNALFNYNNDPQKGLLTGGNTSYQGLLSQYMKPEYLNPYSTPGFSDAMETAKNDVSNSINSTFAAAGRDLSPANSTAVARGVTQAQAPIIQDQYNRNVQTQLGAAGAGYGANVGTAGGLSSLDQAELAARTGGLGAAGAIPGLYSAPAAARLGAANAGYGQPFQNLGMLNSQLLPIAALGSQSTGTGTTTQQTDPLSNIVGAGVGGLALASKLGLLSDERAKENIAPVGMLYDGQPIYSYNYKGHETPQIGLMAQDVEKTTPEAVTEIGGPGGLKAVHYGKATERARNLGMLSHLPMAA